MGAIRRGGFQDIRVGAGAEAVARVGTEAWADRRTGRSIRQEAEAGTGARAEAGAPSFRRGGLLRAVDGAGREDGKGRAIRDGKGPGGRGVQGTWTGEGRRAGTRSEAAAGTGLLGLVEESRVEGYGRGGGGGRGRKGILGLVEGSRRRRVEGVGGKAGKGDDGRRTVDGIGAEAGRWAGTGMRGQVDRSTREEGGTGTGERSGAEAAVGIQAGMGRGIGKGADGIMVEARTAPTRRR